MLHGSSGLDVGFDEPKVFVHFAGDAGEEVDGDGVFQVIGFLDGGAQGVGVVADVVDQEFHHVGAVVGGKIGFGDAGLGDGFADGAVGDATEGGDAFGDRVDMISQVGGDRVEKQVKLVEILPFYIPVGPFDLAVGVDAVGEAEIQQGNDRLAISVGDTYAAGIGADGCGCGFCHGRPPRIWDWPWDWDAGTRGKDRFFWVGKRRTQEHSQEWLCHRRGLVEEDGAGFGYVGVEIVDYVGELLFDYAALEFHGEGEAAAVEGEIVGEEGEAFDGFVGGEVGGEAGDFPFD